MILTEPLLSSSGFGVCAAIGHSFAQMPARIPAKKAMARKPSPAPARKAAAKKPAVAPPPQKSNGSEVETEALKAECEKLGRALSEKEELLRLGQDRIDALERELDEARRSERPAAQLEQQLREMKAKLTTRQVELEAARTEAARLREAASKARGAGEPGNLRCPRCGRHMTEYNHEGGVRADRCDSCHGIFFDNGELETVMAHHDEQLKAGKRHWYSVLFGKR